MQNFTSRSRAHAVCTICVGYCIKVDKECLTPIVKIRNPQIIALFGLKKKMWMSRQQHTTPLGSSSLSRCSISSSLSPCSSVMLLCVSAAILVSLASASISSAAYNGFIGDIIKYQICYVSIFCM